MPLPHLKSLISLVEQELFGRDDAVRQPFHPGLDIGHNTVSMRPAAGDKRRTRRRAEWRRADRVCEPGALPRKRVEVGRLHNRTTGATHNRMVLLVGHEK